MLKRKKIFTMIFLSVFLTLMISIDNVKALTLTDGTQLPDSPVQSFAIVKSYNKYRLVEVVNNNSYYSSSAMVLGSVYSSPTDAYTLTDGQWVFWQRGFTVHCDSFVASNTDIYSDKTLSSLLYSANTGLKVNPNVNVTFHYIDLYNSGFDYGSELITDLPVGTDFSCIAFKSFPKDFVNLVGYSLTNDLSNINIDYSSYKVDTNKDVYFWFIPRFDMELYQSYANDKNTGQDIVYNKLTFTNYFNTLNYSDFYAIVTDLSSNSIVKYLLIDNYFEFNSFYNTNFNVKVYDKNDSLIYNDSIVVNDSHLISLSDYDSYTFSPGYQYAFISSLPNSASIYFFNNDNVFSLGAFSLDTKSIDSTLNIPSFEDNFKITYSYDFTNYSHYILCLQREFTTDYDTFYVPKGAYVSFSSDSFDSNKNYNVPYDYKDDSGNVFFDNSQTVIISDEDKSSNSFFENFLTYLKSFFGVFAFIGNFITDLFNVIPVGITYALCFSFGFVVLTILVKLWL